MFVYVCVLVSVRRTTARRGKQDLGFLCIMIYLLRTLYIFVFIFEIDIPVMGCICFVPYKVQGPTGGVSGILEERVETSRDE